jgi:hypothetical protein
MKVAFLFLIRDIINNPNVWYNFFDMEDKNNYNIYIHYTDVANLGWFDQYKIQPVRTEWADISIVKAMNILLFEALKDKSNNMFIFLSESCVPIRSIKYIRNSLNNRYSYFNINPCQIFPRCNSVLKYLHRNEIKKASQWCILNRKHAEYIVKCKQMFIWFDGVFASDEHCYITALSNKYKNELQNVQTTLATWGYNDTLFIKTTGLIKSTPKEYLLFDINELNHALNMKNLLFVRKILPKCLLSYDTFDAFTLQDDLILLNMDINDKTDVMNALEICQTNNYGGFVNYNGIFYFKKHSCKELCDKNNIIHNVNSTLVINKYFEDHLISLSHMPCNV